MCSSLKTSLRLALLAAAVVLFTPALHSQALPTQSRLGSLQIGGGFSGIRPDYGKVNFYGPTIYATFDVKWHLGVEMDIHMGNFHAPIPSQAEDTYEIGLRYNYRPHYFDRKFNLYPKFLYGRGVFNNVLSSPSQPLDLAYNMYTVGGGLEYDLKPHITIRVADFEAQKWLDFPLPSDQKQLSPYVVTVGAAYHF